MSRAPVQPRRPQKGSGARSFTRGQRAERARAARRRIARARLQRPAGAGSPLRRIPRGAWVCALIALLNAAAWSLILPPFQGRDEIDHFAYTAQLAESQALPHEAPPGVPPTYPPQESEVLQGLHYWQVRFTPYNPAIATVAEQETLSEDASAGYPLRGTGEAGGVGNAPPLYYALQIVPYELGGANVLVKLQLMRLFSVLLGALTVLLVFLFLREILPRASWAATVGAICVALQPMFAFMSGTVNPDVLLYALSAGIFLCLARGFRRRFTRRLAVLLGVLVAAGLLTYFSFIGVALGAYAALLILAARDARARGRAALVAPAIALAIGLAPVLIDGLHNLLAGHKTFGAVSSTGGALTLGSLGNELSYIWQLYLPRLPGMTHYFAGLSTWREVWFDRSVGFYGWMDTIFPGWVDNVALALAIPVALLCVRELVRRRRRLRARLPELGAYLAIVLGVLVMIGVASYAGDVVKHEAALGEPRYLLPLLPLFGALVALAVRGAGRRWMPVAGAALVVLFLGHDLFSQLQVIARYYG